MNQATKTLIPISLYIHIPWCIRKCPYCDFNSYARRDKFPETDYVTRLLLNFQHELPALQGRKLLSIFIGGGTPSLFSTESIHYLLEGIENSLKSSYAFDRQSLEITLEANPGCSDQQRFQGYRQAGINRLSLGIQSFNPNHLQRIGRIHDNVQAKEAIQFAKKAGFDRINIDLMFGLPKQTLNEALDDLHIAIDFQPSHISWYQLTIEPNTYFHKNTPKLPTDDLTWQMQQQGQALLAKDDFVNYEISAYAKPNQQCQHNLNYWLFGDYLGIGAGAHSKITDLQTGNIIRSWCHRSPKDYLDENLNPIAEKKMIPKDQQAFEFMLNTLRLKQPIPIKLFTERTQLGMENIRSGLYQAQTLELLFLHEDNFVVTPRGSQYLNDLIELFL